MPGDTSSQFYFQTKGVNGLTGPDQWPGAHQFDVRINAIHRPSVLVNALVEIIYDRTQVE